MIQHFGAKLRYLRTERHLTQQACAVLVGLARHSHISNLESGRKTPSLEVVCLIARQFAVAVDYLLRDSIAVEDWRSTPDQRVTTDQERPFAGNLRELRTTAGLTQVELAQHLGGISQWHLSHLETGSKGPSLEILLVIADFFGLTVAEVLFGPRDGESAHEDAG